MTAEELVALAEEMGRPHMCEIVLARFRRRVLAEAKTVDDVKRIHKEFRGKSWKEKMLKVIS